MAGPAGTEKGSHYVSLELLCQLLFSIGDTSASWLTLAGMSEWVPLPVAAMQLSCGCQHVRVVVLSATAKLLRRMQLEI